MHAHPPRARDMRQRAVEHLAFLGIRIEAAIDEVADAAPGLRAAPGVGLLDRPDRVGDARRVLLAEAEVADEVAHRDMAEPEHQRVAPGVDQLVDPARLEALLDIEVPVGRMDADLSALVVLSFAALDHGEGPVGRGDLDALAVGIASPGQSRLCRVERDGRMAPRRRAARKRQPVGAGGGDGVFLQHRAGDRFAVFGRDGKGHQHAAVARHQVALPRAPHHGVAASEQEAVARMRQRVRVVGARPVVEELQHPHVAAVAKVVEQALVAARRVGRLQDHEIGGEFHQPLGVDGGVFDVEHGRLRRRLGVDGVMRRPAQPLIRPGVAKFMPVGKGSTLVDSKLDQIGHGAAPYEGWSSNGLSLGRARGSTGISLALYGNGGKAQSPCRRL